MEKAKLKTETNFMEHFLISISRLPKNCIISFFFYHNFICFDKADFRFPTQRNFFSSPLKTFTIKSIAFFFFLFRVHIYLTCVYLNFYAESLITAETFWTKCMKLVSEGCSFVQKHFRTLHFAICVHKYPH